MIIMIIMIIIINNKVSDYKSPSEHRNNYSERKGLRSTKFKQVARLVPKGIRIAEDARGIDARQEPRAARQKRREDVLQLLVGGKVRSARAGMLELSSSRKPAVNLMRSPAATRASMRSHP